MDWIEGVSERRRVVVATGWELDEIDASESRRVVENDSNQFHQDLDDFHFYLINFEEFWFEFWDLWIQTQRKLFFKNFFVKINLKR